jgi:hypothetical protein
MTMSSLPKEMPARQAWLEAELHDAVTEDDRLLLTAVAVDGVDHPGDVLLGHFSLLQTSNGTSLLRQKFADQHAARRGLEDLGKPGCRSASTELEAALDLGVQRDDLAFERMVDSPISENSHALARLVLGLIDR